ncbi:MAG TPA: anti-sigma factor [Sphingobium sp.]|uniref:anti-sigma factor family protein n=1 Tax=unclassified Sphingobium TaxID=2611147 RepID=UPI000EDAD636|nr:MULTISPECIES: anti-sigma factor [unclassified Sphingobium]WIW86984.1 anti-sigma factor [Sphingobium sp. V4]HAF42552.1 anti-sigma factor [Sphingobium sp.]
MNRIDEAMLIALVDGELDEVNRRRVERAVADDPALAARLDLHLRLRARLTAHYLPVAEEPVPERFSALLTDGERVTPITRTAPRWRDWAMGGAIAASLLLGLGIGRMTGEGTGPIGLRDGVMVAQGPLAAALDTQLASAQDGVAIRIGVSFRRKGGGWCRSFDGALAGVACRQGEGWQVQQALPGAGQGTAYRQASSADARVMATVDALIDGAPVDTAGERAAQAGGWR